MNGATLAAKLKLNQTERLLVQLYYFERCTIAECAAVLGIRAYDAERMRQSIYRQAKTIVDNE